MRVELNRPHRGQGAAIGGSGNIFHVHETGVLQIPLHLGGRITPALGGMHQQRGIFGDWQRPGLGGIEVRVVDDKHPAGAQ